MQWTRGNRSGGTGDDNDIYMEIGLRTCIRVGVVEKEQNHLDKQNSKIKQRFVVYICIGIHIIFRCTHTTYSISSRSPVNSQQDRYL